MKGKFYLFTLVLENTHFIFFIPGAVSLKEYKIILLRLLLEINTTGHSSKPFQSIIVRFHRTSLLVADALQVILKTQEIVAGLIY